MTSEAEERRRRELWDTRAAFWEAQREHTWQTARRVSEWLVERVDPRSGDVILEVAAGPGDTGFLAVGRVEPGGRLLSTDFAPAMVAVAQRRAAELGLRNVEFRTLDMAHMNLGDGSVDGVVCRWGYMLVPDPLAAFRETRRVLRHGRRLAFSVWARAEANPWETLLDDALVAHGLIDRPDYDATGGMFSLGDRGRVERLLHAAGFSLEEAEEVPLVWRYADLDEYWEREAEVPGTCAERLAQADPAALAGAREQLARSLEPYRDADAYAVPGSALCVAAT